MSATELDAALRAGAKVVVLEVGRETGEHTEARRSYLAGHLPGAYFVPFEEDLIGPPEAGAGAGPLPRAEDLRERLRVWGVDDDSTVVVHTRQSPAVATRAWWVLRWAGVADVRYLNGGLSAWRRIGGALDTGVPPPGAGTAVVRTGSLPLLTAEEAGRLAAAGHLLDARATEAYVGDPHRTGTGHIPGAHTVPGSHNFADGELAGPATLSALYAAHLDGRAVGAYCGSGVSATTTVLALASLGIEAALYPGSWSAWITDPARPAATGARPGGAHPPPAR
ncbi:sulfurtransferase [Streptomyces paludis]|uniref:thiosulfate sulfurtransferase n=1 Tax=Streptomyces paludis TaxID=2282738 RepID=A0A345I2B9_9ACTN|nr:rhodanese-like domain-containing protein [Streptomyces paludis]AXG83093.1 sulfurtransferase [Streptomyces paludis]